MRSEIQEPAISTIRASKIMRHQLKVAAQALKLAFRRLAQTMRSAAGGLVDIGFIGSKFGASGLSEHLIGIHISDHGILAGQPFTMHRHHRQFDHASAGGLLRDKTGADGIHQTDGNANAQEQSDEFQGAVRKGLHGGLRFNQKGCDGLNCRNLPPELHAVCDELQNAAMVGVFSRMNLCN
jgi:hypothetical protein